MLSQRETTSLLLVPPSDEPQIAFMGTLSGFSLRDTAWWVAYVDIGIGREEARESDLELHLARIPEFNYMILSKPTFVSAPGVTSGLVAAFSDYGLMLSRNPNEVLAEATAILRSHPVIQESR